MADIKSDPAERLAAVISDIAESAVRRIGDAVAEAKKETEEIRNTIDAMKSQRVDMFEKATVLLAQEVDIKTYGGYTPPDDQRLECVAFNVAGGQNYSLLAYNGSRAALPALPNGRYRAFFALVPIEDAKTKTKKSD